MQDGGGLLGASPSPGTPGVGLFSVTDARKISDKIHTGKLRMSEYNEYSFIFKGFF